MNELEDLLKRSDLLKSWDYGYVTRPRGRIRVDFAARIAVRNDAHAKPGGVHFTDAYVELLLEASEGDGLSTILECSAEVVIEGIDAAERICKFALHFDRHDPSVSATELHAHYHWQFGGNRLDGLDCGTLLQLQGPRFPWHPLDPVLLVDFVLGHFNGAKRTELMESGGLTRYPRILHSSQTRLVWTCLVKLESSSEAKRSI